MLVRSERRCVSMEQRQAQSKAELASWPTAADFPELLDFWGFNEGSREEGNQL